MSTTDLSRTATWSAAPGLRRDIAQPLENIRGLAEAASMYVVPAEVRQHLADIIREATALGEHAARVLATAGPHAVNARGMATEVVMHAQAAYPGHIRLTTETDSSVAADPAALRRALTTLVDNAVRHAGPDGEVSVTVREVDGNVTFVVEDSGDNAALATGSPLGLAVVQTLTRQHGGAFDFGDSPLGGARARISLRADPGDVPG